MCGWVLRRRGGGVGGGVAWGEGGEAWLGSGERNWGGGEAVAAVAAAATAARKKVGRSRWAWRGWASAKRFPGAANSDALRHRRIN